MRERFHGLRRVFRLGVWRKELDDELAFHHEATVAELIRSGLSPAKAETEARRRFGNIAKYRRELEVIDGTAARVNLLRTRWEGITASIRYALRRLRRAPLFSAGIIATFALGIGANATVFGILDRVLLNPPPHIVEPEDVRRMMVNQISFFSGARDTVEVNNYLDFVDLVRSPAFSSTAAIGETIMLSEGPDAMEGIGQLVAGNFWGLLGVQPALGRFFGPDDDRLGGPSEAVISYGMWQNRFGGIPDVIGRHLDFGHGSYTIVGVAPRGFTGVDLFPVDVWFPLHVMGVQMRDGDTRCFESRSWCGIRAIVRIHSEYTDQQAEAQATASIRSGRADNPPPAALRDPEVRALLAPLIVARGPFASQESKLVLWLAGITLFVLLIACSNIANLLIARLSGERRESAVRLAVGSSRSRLVGQVVLEVLILATLGGIVAIVITIWGGTAFRKLLLPDLGWDVPGLGLRTATFALGLATIVGLLAAAFPAAQFARTTVGEVLKSGDRTRSARTARIRGILTSLQVALSVVLLVGTGLFVRSVSNVGALDLGIHPDGVFLATPNFGAEISLEEQSQLYRDAVERLERLPTVEAASRDISRPFYSLRAVIRIGSVNGDTVPAGFEPTAHSVDPSYFSAMGLSIHRGRGFGPEDSSASLRVTVISESVAQMLWPSDDPLGQCLIMLHAPADCMEVIGIVADSREASLTGTQPMHFYVPAEQQRIAPLFSGLLLKTSDGTSSVIPDVRAELLALDPRIRSVEIAPLSDLLDPLTRSWRLGAALLGIFGFLALIVAGVGLYSALAYGIAQRKFELGIRTALGARRAHLIELVLREGIVVTGIGVIVGLTAAYLLSPRIEALLFEVSPRDPLTLAGVAVALLSVAALASVVPAYRAVQVDPGVVLRTE